MFGYEISEVLHEGWRNSIYRVRHPDSNAALILKFPNSKASRAERSRALHREWQVLRSLQGDGFVRAHELLRDGVNTALLLEDAGGRSLRRSGIAGALPLCDGLRLALSLVRLLEQVQANGIVHKDFHPANVVRNPVSGTLTLIDFASASLLVGGSTSASLHDRTERLLYSSPELTGRTNRRVDHRSDYYSLGVTLFELLTGVLPFSSEDPLEIVHAHIARQPPLASDVNPGVPPGASRIIAKLLEKDPDRRYQSTAGIHHDLEQCLAALEAGEETAPLPLAGADRRHGFRWTERLYGRGDQLESLKREFDRCRGGEAGLVLVTGPGGVGKSSLIRELQGTVAAARGYFTSGKFARDHSAPPFAALAQALDSFVQQVFTESNERLLELRLRARNALGGAGQALLQLCPSLEFILGAQATPAPLEPEGTRVRLHQALAALLQLAADDTRPLCVFLDDAEAADADSLRLVSELLQAVRGVPVLLVLAARDPDAASPEGATLPGLQDLGSKLRVQQLRLTELTAADLVELVQDALLVPAEAASALANIVFDKTRGNPFFVRVFLGSLHEDGLLELENGALPLEAIRRYPATENVVELLLDRIARLPQATSMALRYAACLGSEFEPWRLDQIAGRCLSAELWPALDADLVLPSRSIHARSELGTRSADVYCRFCHDKIRQAVLETLSASEAHELHLAIGRHLLARSELEPRLTRFEIVSHLNLALPLLKSADERAELARLNLEAARAALARAAGSEALGLVQAGLQALGPEPFDAHAELAEALHWLGADTAFAWAEHEAFAAFADKLSVRARTPLATSRILKLRGRIYQKQFRSQEAIRTYIEALRALGIELSETVTPALVGEEMRATLEALGQRGLDNLVSLPECTDEAARLAMELLSKLLFFAYASNHELLPVATCHLVRLSLSQGNSAESANGYTFFGLLLSRDHDLDRAHRFGVLAMNVARRFDNPEALSQTFLYANYLLVHWKTPFSELARSFETAYRCGLEAGSPGNAAASATTLCICRLWAGEELAQLAVELERYRIVIARFRQELVLSWHDIWGQAVQNLRSDGSEPLQLQGPLFDEAARVGPLRQKNSQSALFNYHVAKMFLGCLFGDYELALAHAEESTPQVQLYATAFWAVPVVFLDSLARLGAYRSVSAEQRAPLLQNVLRNAEKLASWLPHNRTTIEPKLRLVEAELARVRGETDRACKLYDEAIDLASAGDVAYQEALSLECAGRFAQERGARPAARGYLRSAHRAYLRWGALSKAKLLERQHPFDLPRAVTGPVSLAAVSGRHGEFDSLDFVSLFNASHTIATEVRRDQLLQRLTRVLIEAAGAELGILALPRDGSWVVEVVGTADGALYALPDPPSEFTELARRLPLSIVMYAAHQGETVLLHDARNDPRFSGDREIAARGVRSVLCLALKHKASVAAVAYLENNLTTGAFTPSSAKTLEVIAAQAAIALENAYLYDSLEQRVETRTRELREKNDELATTMARLVEVQRRMVVQEKLAALGALTAGIAHEIKNPLTFITNFGQVSLALTQEITETLEPELSALEPNAAGSLKRQLQELSVAVTKISEHGLRASSIVNGMAQHARVGGGKPEWVELHRLLTQCLASTTRSASIPSERLEITTLYDPEITTIEAVPADLSRALVNLLNNARQALEQRYARQAGNYAPRLRVSTHDHDERVDIRVWDNGSGIPEALREKVFLPFFTTKPSGQGTGLGLSIVHDIIVREHAGELQLLSEPDQFTEFVLRLPKRQPPAAGPASSAGKNA